MRCLYCQKKIGLFRRLTDGEYCSRSHRKRMRTVSSRAVRNTVDLDDLSDIWPVHLRPLDESVDKNTVQTNQASTAIFGLVILGALAVGSMGLGGPGGNSSTRLKASAGPFDDIRKSIRNHAAVRLNDNFQGGLQAWTGFSPSTSDWSFHHGFVQPGRLRLWKESLGMTDYQMEFVGEIEKKGMGWAYRAVDNSNFYATKIVITKPGPLPMADLIRYATVNGKQSNRASLPLPMVIRNDTQYRVLLTVRGENFSTAVNGQMVDTWSDSRLASGGIGFFADKGEVASLRWVTVSHRDNILGRMLSFLGFWAPLEPLVYLASLPTLPLP
ncbi:MAG: hypothetical protein ABJF23_07910 [Bryobacteraceae bacterium]